ncbi:carbohydrate kinase family protein [Candidatus Parcubacteria bacterium]|nr:MAG: carbohydrate kinase family protein [Candidatus Parcubacteria bacterium]
MTEYDFVSIGDTVTDAFIRLKLDSARVTISQERRELCMRFGDKIPYENVYVVPGVGNSANAATTAARLGLKTAFVSNVGDDAHGKEIIESLAGEGMSTEFIAVHAGKKTNYHYVLWYKDDRTILIKHEEFDYRLPDIGSPHWVYLSSLGEHAAKFHDALADYFESHPDVKFAFQPGTFQMKMGIDALSRIYRRTEIFFCNKEESQRILGTEESDIKKLLDGIHALGPKAVCITDGPDGAYARDFEDKYWSMPVYPDPKPPVSRTGAGDAFSSTIVAALALGKPFTEALRWGPVNSMSVVQGIGARAGLLKREALEQYLLHAPDGYAPQPL